MGKIFESVLIGPQPYSSSPCVVSVFILYFPLALFRSSSLNVSEFLYGLMTKLVLLC